MAARVAAAMGLSRWAWAPLLLERMDPEGRARAAPRMDVWRELAGVGGRAAAGSAGQHADLAGGGARASCGDRGQRSGDAADAVGLCGAGIAGVSPARA